MSLVSIIMPYYKKKIIVQDSIASILQQTYKNFEIILVNDQPELEAQNYLKEISKIDSRIRIIENKKNLGAGDSRNKAISFAKGDYIAFCDCDDLWNKTKLEKQIKFMKDSNITFSFTAYEVINEKGLKIGLREAQKKIDFKKLKYSCDIGLSTVIIKKEIFQDNTLLFAPLKTKEDFVLWLKMAEKGIELFGLNENLSSWRKSSNSLSSSISQKLFDGYKVYRIYLNYSRIKSLIYLIILSINFILKR